MQPILTTERLLLRPFTQADAPDVQRLAGERDVASTTLNIPHPYPEGMAEAWINSHRENYNQGRLVTFAITRRADEALLGAISLSPNSDHERAELGYWMGKPYWNQGYCTEAARAVVRYGFEAFKLNRIYASHLSRNPASGRVMQKIGMQYEGRFRQHLKKWGVLEDVEWYGLLRSEYKPPESL